MPDGAERLIADLGLAGHAREYTLADDEVLPHLYANATLFSFPLLIEGSGLPVPDVISVDFPVVTSDADAVQETAGGDALIVTARSTAHWIRALHQVLTDRDFAEVSEANMAHSLARPGPSKASRASQRQTKYLQAIRAGPGRRRRHDTAAARRSTGGISRRMTVTQSLSHS